MTRTDKHSTWTPHGILGRLGKDPRLTARVALGALLVANLAAAAVVLHPWGGSPEDLQRQLATLSRDAQQRETATARLRAIAGAVEKTRAEADQFFNENFLDRRTAYSTVLTELNALAEKAGVTARDHSFSYEPVEGSDTLALMVVSGNYEGSYADLVELISLIDRSPRFLTIERLQASPIQSQGTLAINVRLNLFVKGEGETQ